MNDKVENSKNFVSSGATESAPIFFCFAAKGAMEYIRGDVVVTNSNGHFRFYVERDVTQKIGREIISQEPEKIEKEFIQFKNKWKSFDNLIYQYASKDQEDEFKALNELQFLMSKLLFESYKVESIDSLASEIENEIKSTLLKKSVEADLFSELSSPSEFTALQEIRVEAKGEYDLKTLSRRLWFINGTWNGGKIANLKDVEKFRKGTLQLEDLKNRRELQEKTELILDSQTKDIFQILRSLALWREERKIHIQKFTVALDEVIRRLAKKINQERETLIWLLPEEIKKEEFKLARQRKESSVFILEKGKDWKILIGFKSKEFIKGFEKIEKSKEIKGMTACSGAIRGIARVILRTSQSDEFREGEILVTTMTRPEFVPLIKKASAIVTDEGGITSHAAIVAREFKKPCIIGTKFATQIFESGDEIELDTKNGMVRKIK